MAQEWQKLFSNKQIRTSKLLELNIILVNVRHSQNVNTKGSTHLPDVTAVTGLTSVHWYLTYIMPEILGPEFDAIDETWQV